MGVIDISMFCNIFLYFNNEIHKKAIEIKKISISNTYWGPIKMIK